MSEVTTKDLRDYLIAGWSDSQDRLTPRGVEFLAAFDAMAEKAYLYDQVNRGNPTVDDLIEAATELGRSESEELNDAYVNSLKSLLAGAKLRLTLKVEKAEKGELFEKLERLIEAGKNPDMDKLSENEYCVYTGDGHRNAKTLDEALKAVPE